jgi:glycosyltransferase involved in cell wall biosynthesis
MRVILNPEGAFGPRTGVGHYLVELLRCLRAESPADRFDTYPPLCIAWLRRRHGMEYEPADGAPPSPSDTAPVPPPWPLRVLRKYTVSAWRRLRKEVRERWFESRYLGGRYDLYHEPTFIPLPTPLPTVATVHDLSVLRHPRWHPRDRVAYFEKHFDAGLRRCAHILTVSEWTRKELIDVLGLPPGRVTAVANGVRPGLRPLPAAQVAAGRRALGLPGSYLLHVGTLEPRKNLLMLLRAYCALPASLRQRCPLVLAGGWGWNAGALADLYHTEARHKGVVHLGYLPEAHLAAAYCGARALASPSWYEGFGLPPVEMLACGGAVLASDIGPHREALSGQACLLDPRDEAGWRAALARAIADDGWRDGLRLGAARKAAPYTWDAAARRVLHVYHHVAGHGQRLAA